MADILNVEQSIRTVLTRNGNTLYDQFFSEAADTYTVHASDRIVLAANMASFQQADLGDIDGSPAGSRLMVRSDRSITIAINDTAQYIEAEVLAVVGASISALYFKNTDADNEATVEYVVTD